MGMSNIIRCLAAVLQVVLMAMESFMFAGAVASKELTGIWVLLIGLPVVFVGVFAICSAVLYVRGVG